MSNAALKGFRQIIVGNRVSRRKVTTGRPSKKGGVTNNMEDAKGAQVTNAKWRNESLRILFLNEF